MSRDPAQATAPSCGLDRVFACFQRRSLCPWCRVDPKNLSCSLCLAELSVSDPLEYSLQVTAAVCLPQFGAACVYLTATMSACCVPGPLLIMRVQQRGGGTCPLTHRGQGVPLSLSQSRGTAERPNGCWLVFPARPWN